MKTLTTAALCAMIALPAIALPASAAVAQTVAPKAPAAATAPAGTQTNTAHALRTLRTTIVGLTNESVDYNSMTPEVAAKVREQSNRMTPLLRQFGALQNAQALGVENGAEKFRVTFANQKTEWLIGFNPQGKIAVLLFRPVT